MYSVETINIQWAGQQLVSIETPQLKLQPVKISDLNDYMTLFSDKVAMKKYRGSCNEARFSTWVNRWEFHHFSALKVTDKITNDFVGHGILGHGDYENETSGWSEIAFITRPEYWNKKFKKLSVGNFM